MAQTIDKLEQIHIGKKGAAPIAERQAALGAMED